MFGFPSHHQNTHSRHCFDKFPHLIILRAAHFWSNTTCKFFLRTVPALFNKAFTGSNLHLDFLRKLHCVMFERRGIWIWKEHMPSFRTENNTQHYTLYTSNWTVFLAHGLFISQAHFHSEVCGWTVLPGSHWVWAWKTFSFFQ